MADLRMRRINYPRLAIVLLTFIGILLICTNAIRRFIEMEEAIHEGESDETQAVEVLEPDEHPGSIRIPKMKLILFQKSKQSRARI